MTTPLRPPFRAARPRRGEAGLTIVEIAISTLVLAMTSLFSLSVMVSTSELDKVNREESSATAVLQRLTEELNAVPFEQLYAAFNKDPNDDPHGPGTAPGHKFKLFGDDSGNLVLGDPDVVGSWGAGSWVRTDESEQELGGAYDDWKAGLSADELSRLEKGLLSFDESSFTAEKKGKSKVKRKFRRLPVKVKLKWPDANGGELREHKRDVLLGDRQWDLNGDGVIDRLDHRGDYKILPVVIELKWTGSGGKRTHELAHVFSSI